jgi:hypothetical protein
MKVYELIRLLEEAPAGLEVQVVLPNTLATHIKKVESDEEAFYIIGLDAEIVSDANGESLGMLSALQF